MKKEDIHFGDLSRWLFGQTPPVFMIEVIIRTILIYILLLFVVRQMGKRMAGQTTLTEMAVMITIGAIVSPVMQLPDRALLFGVIALGCTYTFQQGINYWAFRRRRIEEITQGRISLLVKDGELMLDEMRKTRVSRQQLYSILREKNIYNLARVERMYLEACGVFSIYETNKKISGLPVTLPTDPTMLSLQVISDGGRKACCNCGHVQIVSNDETPCEICHATEWGNAYSLAN